MHTAYSLELAIRRALNCSSNDFAGLINSSSLEHNAYIGLVSALAPYYNHHNYRARIDRILSKFSNSIGKRYLENSPELKEMADEIDSLIEDIFSDSTINR